MFYQIKILLEKAAIFISFEYSSLGSALKNQSDIIARREYQGLDKVYKFHKKEDDKTVNKDDKYQHL